MNDFQDAIPYRPVSGGEMARRVEAHDWSATPLGPLGKWSQTLKTTVDILLSAPHPIMLAWGPELTMLYNDAYAPRLGERHPAALGRALPDAWPDVWPEIAPMTERVFAGEAVRFTDKLLISTRNGYPENTWWTFSLSPVWDEARQVVGMFNVTVETTAQVLAKQERDAVDARLRASEVRFRAFVTASSDVVYRMSPDWSEMRELNGQGFLADTAAPRRDWLESYIAAEDRPTVEAAIRHAIDTRNLFELEHRVRRADGTLGWTLSRAVPMLDARGEIIEWLGAARDVTARREAEARQSFLLRLSDALRPIGNPSEIQRTATRMLGEHLKASRVFYVAVEQDGDTATILNDYTNGVPSRVGRYSLSAFSSYALGKWRAGQIASCDDVDTNPHYGEAERVAYASVSTRAGLGVPLIKEGRLVALLGVNQASPRHWTGYDIGLASDIAERTWAALERARAEAALRESEARLAAVFEAMPAGVVVADCQGRTMLANSQLRRFLPTSVPPSIDSNRGWRWRAWDAQGQPVEFRDFPGARALRGETTVPGLEMLYTDDDGKEMWTSVAATPIRSKEGEVTGQVGVISDIDSLKRAANVLRESEERLRVLMEGVPQLIWRSGGDGLRTWSGPQWLGYTGQTVGQSQGWGWLDAVHPDDHADARHAWHKALLQGRLEVEYRVRRASDGAWRWHQTRSVPVPDAPEPGKVREPILEWLGTTTEIEDLKRLHHQQQVLVAELQHRTRNLLAVVRNIAHRSVVPSPGLDQYDARLSALSRVQGFLSHSATYSALLADVVRAELEAAGGGASDRVWVDGPAVELPGESVQIVALALHELATNAAKYGAIAQPSGRLAVTWHLEDGHAAGQRRLVIDWRESGVAVPKGPPARRGYGSELITRALPYQLGAETALEFAADGVKCRVVLPAT